MKRLISILLALIPLASHAIEPIDSVFLEIPESILPLLPVSSRLDMLDYRDAGMKARGENLLEGKSEILASDSTYMLLRLTPVSEMEILLLPDGRCLTLTTLRARHARTRVHIYNGEWEELPSEALVPTFEASVPYVARLTPDRHAIRYVPSLDGFTAEDQERLRPQCREHTVSIF